MSMNSGQEASPDLPDDESVDPAEAADVDPKEEALQRSQDAIDEGREAAREALPDNPPDAEPSEPGNPES